MQSKQSGSVNEVFLAKFQKLHLEKEEIKQMDPAAYQEQKYLIQKVQKATSVDILFFMDCTISMGKWIVQAKETIIQIIQKATKTFKDHTFKVGFVAYRDFESNPNIETIDFKENIEEVVAFIGQLKEGNGGDYAEDVIGGLKAGHELSFSADLLCCFFIADAPSHGFQYHGDKRPGFDKYSLDIPEGTLEKVLQEYKTKAENVEFCCLKLNDLTDVMFQKMKVAIPNLSIQKLGDVFQFAEVITQTITRIVSDPKPKTVVPIEGDGLTTKAKYWSVIFPSFPKNPEEINEEYLKNFKDQLKYSEEECEVKILNDVIGDGACSYAYKIHDLTRNKFMIGKISKQELTIEEANNVVKQRIASQAYALFFAQYYRYITAEMKLTSAPPIFVLPPSFYVLNKPFNQVRHIYSEQVLEENQEWKRYSNNYAHCASQSMASFSHFSWAISFKYLMVTDLQGKGFILTDPAIHSEDTKIFSESTNKGKEGYVAFFTRQHQECNKESVCHKMGLERLEVPRLLGTTSAIPISSVTTKEEFKEVMIICSLCNSFDTFPRQVYLDKMKLYRGATWCNQCENEEEQSILCKFCATEFKYKLSLYNKLGFSKPTKCKECRIVKIANCTQCQNEERILNQLYLKKTKNQLLPYTCKACTNKSQEIWCAFGKHIIEVRVQLVQNCRDLERYACKDCIDNCKKYECKICNNMICSKIFAIQVFVDLIFGFIFEEILFCSSYLLLQFYQSRVPLSVHSISLKLFVIAILETLKIFTYPLVPLKILLTSELFAIYNKRSSKVVMKMRSLRSLMIINGFLNINEGATQLLQDGIKIIITILFICIIL